MVELSASRLNPESQLLLEQPLIRLPYEICRRNFKIAQRNIERDRELVLTGAKNAATLAAESGDSDQVLAVMDGLITKMQTLKRKIEVLQEEERICHENSRLRIEHLKNLFTITDVAEVKYDRFSMVRLNRLLCDYLLRQGHVETAKILAKEADIEGLIDQGAFLDCRKIEASLMAGKVTEALAWVSENRVMISKPSDRGGKERSRMSVDLSVTDASVTPPLLNQLEFELRLQQIIDYARKGDILNACIHSKKYLSPHANSFPVEVEKAGGIVLAGVSAGQQHDGPYKSYYSADRWLHLAKLFRRTHNGVYGLSQTPGLHVALSLGLSTLKTPACHSAYTSSSSNANSASTSVCPICSTELNALARNFPNAHHDKSSVESDPVVLPNGRIYGRERLEATNQKLMTEPGKIKDPVTGELFPMSSVRKVYIT